MMKVMNLRNGTQEVAPLVAVVMMKVKALWNDTAKGGPISLYELVYKLRDPEHRFFGDHEGRLKDAGLWPVESASERNVILSAFEGEGLAMALVNPVVPG